MVWSLVFRIIIKRTPTEVGRGVRLIMLTDVLRATNVLIVRGVIVLRILICTRMDCAYNECSETVWLQNHESKRVFWEQRSSFRIACNGMISTNVSDLEERA